MFNIIEVCLSGHRYRWCDKDLSSKVFDENPDKLPPRYITPDIDPTGANGAYVLIDEKERG